MRGFGENRQRAVVIHQVDPLGEPDEPVIRLESGEEVVPIWIDRYILLDTWGTAEWVEDRNAWKFIPDGG